MAKALFAMRNRSAEAPDSRATLTHPRLNFP